MTSFAECIAYHGVIAWYITVFTTYTVYPDKTNLNAQTFSVNRETERLEHLQFLGLICEHLPPLAQYNHLVQYLYTAFSWSRLQVN